MMKYEWLLAEGFTVSESIGDTLVSDLRGRHVDLVQLNADGIMQLARRIATEVRSGNGIRRKCKDICALVRTAAAQKRLDVNLLSDNVKKQIAE
jgi:hypothetical protein